MKSILHISGDIDTPNSVTSTGYAAFSGQKLNSVTIPNSLKTIGYAAFSGNSLTLVYIGNGVESIGQRSFFSNEITSVTIPNSVKSIGKEAFDNKNGYTINEVKVSGDYYLILVNNINNERKDIFRTNNVQLFSLRTKK